MNVFDRFDSNLDCSDGSDESNCDTIRIPDSYEKSAPPELKRDLMEANPIFTQIDILNIDFIDTVTMSAGMTVEIQMTWRDHKLVFENILDGKENLHSFKVIAKREFEKIWLPMPEIIHENAVIGKVTEDKVFNVKIVGRSLPEEINLEEDVEALLYFGSKNDLVMSQRFKLEYRCDFFLRNYPFDEQACNFILMMKLKGNNSIKFAENNPPVIYKGPRILREFEVTNLLANTSLRFMGALTSLLVLAALLSSINSSLPQTVYFKHIDFGFFFFIINIVLIIFVHIVIDFFLNQEKDVVSPLIITSMPKMQKRSLHLKKPEIKKKSTLVNKIAKISIPVMILLFITLYFEITTTM